jgi:hypothetical protein
MLTVVFPDFEQDVYWFYLVLRVVLVMIPDEADTLKVCCGTS